MITCPLCGFTFDEADGRSACASCALGSRSEACHFIRCPNCFYEIPAEAGLVKRIKSWRNRRRGRTKVQ